MRMTLSLRFPERTSTIISWSKRQLVISKRENHKQLLEVAPNQKDDLISYKIFKANSWLIRRDLVDKSKMNLIQAPLVKRNLLLLIRLPPVTCPIDWTEMQKVKPFMVKLLHESTPRIPKKTDNLAGQKVLDMFNRNRWSVLISTLSANSVMTNTRQLQTSSPAKRLTAKVLLMTHSSMITDRKVSKKWTSFITLRLICLVSSIRPLD